MNIIPNGTKVEIIDSGIKGVIHSACINGIETPEIQYKVVWWVSGTRHYEWLEFFEVKIFLDTRKPAGLVNYETGLTNNK